MKPVMRCVLCSFLLLSMATGFACGQQETPSSLSGFESSELYGVQDGVELDPNAAMLRQLVFRSKSISNDSLERYSQYSKDVDDEKLIADTQQHRFWVFHREARVTRIARQKLPDDLASGEFSEFWLLIAENGAQKYAIISRTIPASWRKLETLSEPIEMKGFLFGLKTMPRFVESGDSIPVFVCERVSWYPDQLRSQVNIGPTQLYLAEQGVDLSYLDMVRRNQKRRMLAEENDYFYQLLGAAIDSQKNPVAIGDLPALGFIDLIKDANLHLGSVVEIEGNVRRIVAVPITSAKERERLGIDHFYELDMYVPLTDVAKIRAKDKDGNDIEYNERFPVTVHVPSLPEAVTEYRHNRVRVKGFFYRMWSYQSEFAKQTNQSGQMSPLVIGFEPKILRASTRMLDTILTIAAATFILGLFGLILYLRRSDKNSDSPLRRAEELPDKVEIPGIE